MTTVYVTHDQVEAMTLGQRVAVMRSGQDRPGRHAAAALRRAARPLRRRVHRLARDEPGRGDGRGRRSSASASSASRSRPAPRPPTARSILGIRPESFEDAPSRPTLPTIDVVVEVLEELGSDAHVFFTVDARSITAEALEAADDARGLIAGGGALFTARVDAAHRRPRRRAGRRSRSTRAAPVLRSRDRAAPRCRARRRSRRADLAAMTKQREAREQVLELIETLEVGDAIPSERAAQPSTLGVSRLTLRAALDELVREGRLTRRRGAGTFVAEPKVAKGMTITSFSDDMRQRGLTPGSRTLEFRTIPAGARLGRILHVSPSEPVLVGQAAPPRRRRADGGRAAARPRERSSRA